MNFIVDPDGIILHTPMEHLLIIFPEMKWGRILPVQSVKRNPWLCTNFFDTKEKCFIFERWSHQVEIQTDHDNKGLEIRYFMTRRTAHERFECFNISYDDVLVFKEWKKI
jgi:hypothetical protein